jgi:enoyl-CoA hydratase
MPDLLVERHGAVMVATMNRPERKNAMTLQMFGRMRDAWKEASEDDDIRCIVLTGTGGDFCAGMDLRGLSGDKAETDDWDVEGAMATEGADFIWQGLLKTSRPTKPVIAAVEGVAIAGGTEILQGTDIRIAAESAKFGVSEVKWSLYPMGGSAVRLARQIGYAEAADILLTGKHITAAEAKAMGLISRVVPDGTALEHAMEVAEIVAGNGPLAVEAVLKTLHDTPGMTEAEAFAHEDTYTGAVMASEDSKEGPKAFAEKRTPNFQRK